MFGSILTTALTLMQAYVFWRAAGVPAIARRIPCRWLIGIGLLLWVVFLAGRFWDRADESIAAVPLEMISMNWLATIFLCTVCLLAMDLLTGFGFLVRRYAPSLRGWALVAGLLLSGVAMIQGMRAPVIEKQEVLIANLPARLDGTVVVALSDLHWGTLLGERWLAARVRQVQEEKPDLILLLGDLFEGHGRPAGDAVSLLQGLSAPLGVWAVSGNHDSHGGANNGRVLARAGIQLLDNRRVEVAPGLYLAGVAARGHGSGPPPAGPVIPAAASNATEKPVVPETAGAPGATLLLSHYPDQAEAAASAGAGLMLSGHTHGGQIWPFSYLVQTRSPLLAGRYDVRGMPVYVSRGTGTWGPRMRLWLPGEITRLTLRSPAKAAPIPIRK